MLETLVRLATWDPVESSNRCPPTAHPEVTSLLGVMSHQCTPVKLKKISTSLNPSCSSPSPVAPRPKEQEGMSRYVCHHQDRKETDSVRGGSDKHQLLPLPPIALLAPQPLHAAPCSHWLFSKSPEQGVACDCLLPPPPPLQQWTLTKAAAANTTSCY